MFAWIFKLVATAASIATTVLLAAESLRQGLIVATTIFGVVKIIVILLFLSVLAVILYLLLRARPAEELN